MHSYIKVIAALIAFLLAGLILGYIFSSTGTEDSVSLSDGDFSKLFINSNSEIIVYTLPECPFCHRLKDFLDQHGIRFDERSVHGNQKNYQEAVDLGSDRVPILITRSFKIEGFMEQEVANILIEKGYIKNSEKSG